MARTAFSLLEVLISLTLGLVILITVYAGFRVAVQSITIAERRALENKLLVAGTMIVLDQADTWFDLDIPSDPSRQALRTVPSKSIGALDMPYHTEANDWQELPQPFTALSASWDMSGTSSLYRPALWHPHNPESWYRGDGGLYFGPGQGVYNDESAYGNYALASAVGARDIDLFGDGSVSRPPRTSWLADQHQGLRYSLGFYGWFDYLPANAMLDFSSRHSDNRALRPYELRVLRNMTERDWGNSLGSTTDDAAYLWNIRSPRYHGRFAEQAWWSSSGNPGYWYMTTLNRSGAERAVTRGSYLRDLQTGISGPRPTDNATQQRYAASVNRIVSGTYGHGLEPINAITNLIQSLNREVSPIAEPPATWPALLVGTRRMMHMGGINTYSFVRIVDPVTGAAKELFIPILGSTLRGARLSRGLDQ